MSGFLDNWATSTCWDQKLPEPEPNLEISDSAVPPEPAPITPAAVLPELDAGALLVALGISVRYVRTLEEAEIVVALLAAHDGHIGLDVETAKLPAHATHPQAGLNPHLSQIRLVQLYAGGAEAFVFDLWSIPGEVLRPLLDKRFVAHNAIFELQHMIHVGLEPTSVDCTMLQVNALTGRRPGLSTVACEELGWVISKEHQASDWNAPKLSTEQIEYAALDAVIVHRLFPVLAEKIRRKNRQRCYELMRDAQHVIARMQLNGVFFDRQAQLSFIQKWTLEREEARQQLVSLFGSGLNLRSSPQLSTAIAKNLDTALLRRWPRGKGGQLKTGAKVLALFPDVPFVQPLQDWKIANKKLSSFGDRFAAHINPVTGRIHASFRIGGTATGRFACRKPNIQNLPRGSFRALFAAPAGRVMVVADYSQIELRVIALVAKEKTMLRAYQQGGDLHNNTAAALLGIPTAARVDVAVRYAICGGCS